MKLRRHKQTIETAILLRQKGCSASRPSPLLVELTVQAVNVQLFLLDLVVPFPDLELVPCSSALAPGQAAPGQRIT